MRLEPCCTRLRRSSVTSQLWRTVHVSLLDWEVLFSFTAWLMSRKNIVRELHVNFSPTHIYRSGRIVYAPAAHCALLRAIATGLPRLQLAVGLKQLVEEDPEVQAAYQNLLRLRPRMELKH